MNFDNYDNQGFQFFSCWVDWNLCGFQATHNRITKTSFITFGGLQLTWNWQGECLTVRKVKTSFKKINWRFWNAKNKKA